MFVHGAAAGQRETSAKEAEEGEKCLQLMEEQLIFSLFESEEQLSQTCLQSFYEFLKAHWEKHFWNCCEATTCTPSVALQWMHGWKKSHLPVGKRAVRCWNPAGETATFVPVMPPRLRRKMSPTEHGFGKRAGVRCFPLNAVDRKERLLQTPSLTLRWLTAGALRAVRGAVCSRLPHEHRRGPAESGSRSVFILCHCQTHLTYFIIF